MNTGFSTSCYCKFLYFLKHRDFHFPAGGAPCPVRREMPNSLVVEKKAGLPSTRDFERGFERDFELQ